MLFITIFIFNWSACKIGEVLYRITDVQDNLTMSFFDRFILENSLQLNVKLKQTIKVTLSCNVNKNNYRKLCNNVISFINKILYHIFVCFYLKKKFCPNKYLDVI